MKEYIEREAVRQAHIKASLTTRLIDAQPAADVAPVVRCKDCRYWQDNNGGYPHPECRWGDDETPNADDYCSFGEREEADQ